MRCLHRLSHYYKGAILAVLCCMVLWAAPATAQVSWKRVGTVTTLTSGQLCKTDGTVIICDGTTPTIVSGLVGIGTTLPSQRLTVGGNIDITGTNGYLTEISNDGTTGTTASKLAKLTASGAAIIAATTDTDGMLGVVTGGAGTTGNAQIAVDGQASCVFDGATTTDDYVEGAPELIAEIAHSSRAIDLHGKRDDYARYGVREYLVLCLRERQLRWFDLAANRELQADADGVFRMHALPGLWIHGEALLARDHRRLTATLNQGLTTPEHAAFAVRLSSHGAAGQ